MTVDALTANLACEVTNIRLKDLALPVYDQDEEVENGLHEGARKLRTLMETHQGVIIGCPEYNGFMTPLLINAINWATRSEQATPDLSVFQDKIFLIASTSLGGLAGIRAVSHLRTMLSGIGALVVPDTFSVPMAMQNFDEIGELIDENQQARARAVAQKFQAFVEKNS